MSLWSSYLDVSRFRSTEHVDVIARTLIRPSQVARQRAKCVRSRKPGRRVDIQSIERIVVQIVHGLTSWSAVDGQ